MLAVTACHYALNEPGTEPQPDRLYFPTGLVVDPARRYLYVSNANADLRFAGGTIEVIDLQRFDCAVSQFQGVLDPMQCPQAQAAADSSGPRGCVYDPLDPSVIDCDEGPYIFGNTTVGVGNFAGNMRLQIRDLLTRTLFVAVRGDPSITWINVDLNRDLTVPGGLDCFDNPASIISRPGYNPTTRTTTAPPRCDPSHLVQNYCKPDAGQAAARPSPDCPAGSTLLNLPPEPFALQLDEGLRVSAAPYKRLVVSHLSTGQVTVMDVSGPPRITSVSDSLFPPDPSNRRGAFALAPLRPGVANSTWYLTSNLQAVIATFRIADADVVVPAQPFFIGGAFSFGNDVRDIVFDPSLPRAFLTDNIPPSVVVLDTRPLPTSIPPGQPANQVVDVVDVCQTPSHLGLRQVMVPAVGGGLRLQTLLYVVCFLSGQVMVVDPDTAHVLDTILIGGGPNDIAFSTTRPARAYTTNFIDSTIAVIDLEPSVVRQDTGQRIANRNYNRVIARIGIPRPGGRR